MPKKKDKIEIYEYYKRIIAQEAKSHEEYERRIKALARRLGI
jgi:hypothetical protein